MIIRLVEPRDHEAVWQIFHEIVAKGDTYAIPPETTRAEAVALWIEKPTATFVAEKDGEILGTYYIKPNQMKPGDHVCNCGYMVSAVGRGQGVATSMCEHSQKKAIEFGFKAMQFNLVVSTNEGAIHLWQKLGFAIVGTIPKAFNHLQQGFVDAHVMYKWMGT